MQTTNYRVVFSGDELYHHGILGQKWGIRRYQNPDGTLTDAGRKRYYKELRKTVTNNDYRSQATKMRNDLDKEVGGDKGTSKARLKEIKRLRNEETEEENKLQLRKAVNPNKWVKEDNRKAALAVGATAGTAAALSAAGHKISLSSLASFSGNLGSTAAKSAIAAMGAGVVGTTLAGSVAFTVGSLATAYILDKYGNTDVRDLFRRRAN